MGVEAMIFILAWIVALKFSGLIPRFCNAALKEMARRAIEAPSNPMAAESDHFVPIGTKIAAVKCEGCGGYCGDDIEKCIANMEADPEPEVNRKVTAEEKLRHRLQVLQGLERSAAEILTLAGVCDDVRINPSDLESIRFDMITSQVKLRVSGSGDVSINCESIELLGSHGNRALKQLRGAVAARDRSL